MSEQDELLKELRAAIAEIDKMHQENYELWESYFSKGEIEMAKVMDFMNVGLSDAKEVLQKHLSKFVGDMFDDDEY